MSPFEGLLDRLVAAGARNPCVRIEAADGAVVFEGARGEARPGGPAMTARTPFHTASVTKTFTAVLAVQLAEEGRLGPAGLDAPIGELPRPAGLPLDRMSVLAGEAVGERLTVRQILTHTSGLRDAFTDGEDPLGAALMRDDRGRRRWVPWDATKPDDPEAGVVNWYLAKGLGLDPAGPPGGAFHYSDTGYMLLGLIIEQVVGQDLPTVLRERILRPLDLQDTWFVGLEAPPQRNGATVEEAEAWRGDLPMQSSGYDLSFDWGGGGLIASAPDLARFLRALLAGRLFRTAASLQAMTGWISPVGIAAPRIAVGLGLDRLRHEDLEWIGRSGYWGARMILDVRTGALLTGATNQAEPIADWPHAFLAAARQDDRSS